MDTNTDAGRGWDFAARAHAEKTDERTPRRRMTETIEAWSYILGLATMAITWALVAYFSIGNTTMHRFDYDLNDTTPASHAMTNSEIP